MSLAIPNKNLSPFNLSEKLKDVESYHYFDENQLVENLLNQIPKNINWNGVEKNTIELVEKARADKKRQTMMDSLMSEYSLNNKEGILLMCLAEALIRIPDEKTAEKFIHSILHSGNWQSHIQDNHSLFINASTWALVLGDKVFNYLISPHQVLVNLVSKVGLKGMRAAITQSITVIAKQFVLSEKIDKALSNGKNQIKQGYIYTFDMLGEAALSMKDAEKYYKKYYDAIAYLGSLKNKEHSISIKLSALYPRYEYRQRDDVLVYLYQKLEKLIYFAIDNGIAVSIDAEESERLVLSLELIEKLLSNSKISQSNKLGVVVQAYGKRALKVLEFLNDLASHYQTKIPIRLVKGAYWDSEIKKSQQLGLSDFPVFTRKENTDLNYLIAADYLFKNEVQQNIIPQFATHNAHTISSILEMSKNNPGAQFEFQKLHGMGENLYAGVLKKGVINCRIYAPIGEHRFLLPYLVRRLLENGANTSFVNRLIDAKLPASKLAVHPFTEIKNNASYSNQKIKKSSQIFYPRKNSQGINIQDINEKIKFENLTQKFEKNKWDAKSLLSFENKAEFELKKLLSPCNVNHMVGEVEFLKNDRELVNKIFKGAKKAFENQNNDFESLTKRAKLLYKFAQLLEENSDELVALCVYETGKVYQDAIDEIREAVDFCRYYADIGLNNLTEQKLPSVSGENNTLSYSGKGVFLCISPWNFPLAIFIGQIAAAFMAGNSIVAKPSPLSPLIAYKAVKLMHKAGMSKKIIQLVICLDEMNNSLTQNSLVNGVIFTGSTQTAKKIEDCLVARKNTPIATFIAETGGLNALIVDSTALCEQVVIDILSSAFQSAGQRCSALRIALVQESIYDEVLELLKGAMDLLKINHPKNIQTDMGPVIDKTAFNKINDYIKAMKKSFNVVSPQIEPSNFGYYIAPHLIEINQFEDIKEEIFAPIVHILKYKNNELNSMIKKINQSGFGLTLGIHSRNQKTQEEIVKKANVGNIYINRNQIGAVVGSQPFGGRGFSGTGPKAGGPNYLMRLVDEKTVSNNIAAIGGNPDLLGSN